MWLGIKLMVLPSKILLGNIYDLESVIPSHRGPNPRSHFTPPSLFQTTQAQFLYNKGNVESGHIFLIFQFFWIKGINIRRNDLTEWKSQESHFEGKYSKQNYFVKK